MKPATVNLIDAYRNYRWSASRSDLWLAAGALGVAIVLGALSSVLPPVMMLVALVALVMIGISVTRPYLGLIAALMLIFEVIPEDYQPGVGKLRAYDVMVVLLTAFVVLRTLSRSESVLKHLGSMIWPLAYLFACLGISIFYVKYYSPNEFMLSEARAQFIWLLLPLAVMSVDSRARFKHFMIGIIFIALVVALYVSLESLFQFKFMGEKRIMPLDVFGNSDIVRSTAGGGIYILTFALLLCINMMLERQLKLWAGIPLVLMLCLGLAVQYGRGVWIATTIGLLISACVYRGWSGLFRVAVAGVLGVSLFLGGMAVVKPRVAQALVERATGIGDELESGGSFGFRKMENRYALAAIEKHPIVGVGIGGIYKPTVTAAGWGWLNETVYIHNSWLWFPLKLGLIASLVPFVFILCFCREIYRGIRHSGGRADGARWFVGAIAGAFVVPIVASYTQPEWADPQGIAALATLIACALLYIRWGSPFQAAAKPLSLTPAPAGHRGWNRTLGLPR